MEVAKLRGQSPAGKARWRPAGSHVSDGPTCWSCTSTAASTAGGAVAASLGLRHPSAAPGSAWAGGLCGGEAWASGEGRRAEVCAPKKSPVHTRSGDAVHGSKRTVQRGSSRRYGLGQRAHAVASRGDEGAVVSLRQGALCKNYLLQTARNTALYVPSCALVLQP